MGGGGGLLQKFYDGVCGPNLEGTPYSYKAQARNHTYSCNLAKNITFWYNLMGSRKEDSKKMP